MFGIPECPDTLPETDQHIIEIIRRGQTRQYAVLVDRCKEQAMTLAVRLIGDREEAEELVQDAFLRAYRNLDQFRGDSRFSTWLYRILYNLCITRVNRRKGKPEALDTQDEQFLDNLFVDDEAASAHELLEEQEMQQLLNQEIEQLPQKFKEAIVLFYLEEMSYDEMAAVLNVPLGTVKTNLFRGRNELRRKVLAHMNKEVKA